MSLNILFAAGPESWSAYQAPLDTALTSAGITAEIRQDFPAQTVDYIIYAPSSELRDFTDFTKTKAVLNLWAGVERIVDNPTLTQPLTRMVGGGLTEGMVEWVTGHVLRHHLGMDRHIHNMDRRWEERVPPLAHSRKVAILGLGALGTACGESLHSLGFEVHGWARRPKDHAGITCHHGSAGLAEALNGADVVVLLLPDTPQTENVLDGAALARMAPGGFVLNPGRGPLIDDDALLAALDRGHIQHATLDVFRVEPLPKDHPFWAHPGITITPHVASATRPAMAAQVIAENIRRSEAGEPLLHLVDREAGY